MSKRLSLIICLALFLLGLRPITTPVFAQTLKLDLKTSTTLALKNNPRIDIYKQQKLQSQGILTQAQSGYLPHVAAGADVGRQYIDDLKPEDEDTVLHATVYASQLIYDFGNTGGAIRASHNRVEAASGNLKQTQKDIVFACKREFYSILARRRLIEVEKEAVNNYKQQLYRAQKYFAAGIRTKIDVTYAKVNLSNTRLTLLQARSNLQTARVRFEQVLGTIPAHGNYTVIQNEGELTALASSKPDLPQSLNQLLETAFSYRSDLQAIRFHVKASAAEIDQARSGYFPSIDARASYDEYDSDLSSAQDQWYLGLNLTWELFSGFETKGKTATANARLDEVNAGHKELELAIIQEVTDSWLRGIEYRDSVDIASETMNLARENFILADKRYKAGLNDMIEYNDAQLSLTRAQSNLVTTYYNYLTALARIENAVGVIPELTLQEPEKVHTN